jgi:NADPH2:quinone reductase
MTSLPGTMRQIAADRPGGPEVLTLVDGPLPVLRDGEVLIRVAAAGVNRVDCQ